MLSPVTKRIESKEVIKRVLADDQDDLARAQIASELRHELVEAVNYHLSFDDFKTAELRSILGEACDNATGHATYHGSVIAEIIRIEGCATNDFDLSLRLSNPSNGFKKRRLKIPDLTIVGLDEHGRGIMMIAEFVRSLGQSLCHDGRCLRCGYYFDHCGNPKMGTTVFCLDFLWRSNGRTRTQFNG